MESDHDPGSSHHLDSSSGHNSNPGLNLGSRTRSSSSSGSSSDSSDDDRGDFMDMFKGKGKSSTTPKKPESWPQSGSHSRSWETENQKRCHIPSPDNMPNLDKPDWKKKKSDQKETPSKNSSKLGHKSESAKDKVTRELGEELVCKFQADEEE